MYKVRVQQYPNVWVSLPSSMLSEQLSSVMLFSLRLRSREREECFDVWSKPRRSGEAWTEVLWWLLCWSG